MTAIPHWHIYRGTKEPHDGIGQLPSPPPWRAFEGPVVDQSVPEPTGNGAGGHRVNAAAGYLPEADTIELTNISLLLRRPLLVTGKPGTGKSTLARSIAYELGLGPVLHWPISSQSRLSDALYQYDAIGRLQQTNLARVGAGSDQACRSASSSGSARWARRWSGGISRGCC